jgi:zona occludens toxin (predicted ATPase)
LAVLLITGVAGTGKTLYAIQRYIIPELKKGNKVFTNIDGIITSRISLLFGIDIIEAERNLKKIENPKEFWKELEINSLAVIDEGQNIFNNRDWADDANKECVKYLFEHRHWGHSVLFITPHIDSLDAGIRRAAQFTYKHKSFSAIGAVKTVRCAVFDQCEIAKGAVEYFTWKHDSRIYDCYSSYFQDGTKEKKVRIHPFRNLTVYFLVSVIVFGSIFSVSPFKKFIGRLSKKKNVTIAEKTIENKNNKNVISTKNVNIIKINDSIIYVGNRNQ